MLLLALLLQQAPPPTVGDTIWITRTVTVGSGVTVRPRPIAPSAFLQPLAPPGIALVGNEVRLRYPVVAWQPGSQTVEIPGVILVRNDGWSDTLPPTPVTIVVASVLPPQTRDSLAPRPPAALVERSSRSLAPALWLVLVTLLALLPLHWWWRRRNPPAPEPVWSPARGPSLAALASWASAGELRAALDGWLFLVSAMPSDPEAEVLLGRLRDARYGPEDRPRWIALCEEASAWVAARGGR